MDQPRRGLARTLGVYPPATRGGSQGAASRLGANPIDYFVLARLQREGLAPSPEAPRETLIRRVSLDLTGLPPTAQQVHAFVDDTADDAYERMVDRFLASPRYGERMALPWLEAARYADTDGYQNDGPRYLWRWRDWVIDALNANMPFDRFTIEQLAGDLLPQASLDQRIATGFNRNHRYNSEEGLVVEEFLLENAVDRVDTTCAVWMGLTMGCARCHDHKFDPFAQREYYRLIAFFDNVPETGRAVKFGNSEPYVTAPTATQQIQLQAREREIEQARRRFAELEPRIAQTQRAWEASLANDSFREQTSVADGLAAHWRFEGDLANEIPDTPEAKPVGGEAEFTSGVAGRALRLDCKREVHAGQVGDFRNVAKYSISLWLRRKM